MYNELKSTVLTDEGQRRFLKVRDAAHKLLGQSGAVRLGELLTAANISGDSWEMLACVDRLVELGELKEVYYGGATQYKVYIAGRY